MANTTMTVKFNNVKNMFKGRSLLLIGKVRTNLSAAKVSLLSPESREITRIKWDSEIRKLVEEIREYGDRLGKLQKEKIVESNKELDDHYDDLIEKEKDKLDKAHTRLKKYKEKISHLDDELAAFYEVKVSKDTKKQDHSSDNSTKKAKQKRNNLYSYFVDDRFEFGDKVIETSTKKPGKMYVEIMQEFRKAENSKYMNEARKIEALGRTLVGEDFIRKFYSLNVQNRRTVLKNLSVKLREAPLPEGFADKSIDEQVNILKSLSLPSYRNNMLNILENQKTNKFIAEKIENNIKSPKGLQDAETKGSNSKSEQPAVSIVSVEEINKDEPKEAKLNQQIMTAKENIQDIDLSDIEEPVIKEAVQENIATEIAPIEKDAHTLAIEEAQSRLNEVEAQIKNHRDKHRIKMDQAIAMGGTGFNVAIGDIIADNYASYQDEVRDLEIEKSKLLDEIKQNEDARRQEKIDADKKAREERLKEINAKAKEKREKQQHAKELAEAKQVLSHLETSTGTYNIENMTDEEILEVYNAINESTSLIMAVRLEKAKEAVQNDKNKEIEPSMAPETKEDVSEVVEEPISNEPVESKVELKGLNEDELEQQQIAKEIEEAKQILSHLETNIGTYNVENMPNEEILKIYNDMKESPSMTERIEKAKEAAQNDKNKEIEPSMAPETKEDVSEVVEEPISNEPVKSKVELKGLNEDELEQLSNKSKEQNKVLEDKVQEIMENFGVSEVQARTALKDPVVMQVIEQTYGNSSEEKTESKSK